jgi:DNA helicase-2/ATP-dependent DNA helicase PcrA
MTVHLSKWLEFENVIIAGAEEGLFPHSRSLLEQNEIEEERRLMYVAMTRAKQILYISRAKERYTFWNYSANPASRFLKEIPAELTKNHTIQVSNNFFGNFRQPSSNFWGYSVGEKLIPKEKKERPTIAAGSLGLGDRVRHEKFGIGTIVALSGVIADIAFPETGIKKMNLEIAPLVRQ